MFTLTLLSVPLLIGANLLNADACEVIQSALNVGDALYLKTDHRVIKTVYGKEDCSGAPANQPFDLGQDAAVSLPAHHQYVFITGNSATVENDDRFPPLDIPFPESQFLKIDAATRRGDEVWLFSGAHYQTFNYVTSSPLSTPRDVKELNLPEDLDAAWFDREAKATIVVKGDKFYVGDLGYDDNYFFGPVPLNFLLSIPSLKMCPHGVSKPNLPYTIQPCHRIGS